MFQPLAKENCNGVLTQGVGARRMRFEFRPSVGAAKPMSSQLLTACLGLAPAILPPVCAQTRFCGYNIVEIMSSGSFGNVYKVRKNGSDELFAVKVIVKTSRTAQRSEEQSRQAS